MDFTYTAYAATIKQIPFEHKGVQHDCAVEYDDTPGELYGVPFSALQRPGAVRTLHDMDRTREKTWGKMYQELHWERLKPETVKRICRAMALDYCCLNWE